MDYEQIAIALQQRIGEMAARYEADLAVQRVNYEAQIKGLQAQIDSLTQAGEPTTTEPKGAVSAQSAGS